MKLVGFGSLASIYISNLINRNFVIFDSCNGKYAAISYFFLQTVVLINMSMKVYCHSKYNSLVPFLLYFIWLPHPSIPPPHIAHGLP